MFNFMRKRRGSAMMQVLVLGSIIASIVILLLRFAVTRTVNITKTRRMIAAKAYAEGCMAQFTSVAFRRELHGRPPYDNTSGVYDLQNDFMLQAIGEGGFPSMSSGNFICRIIPGPGPGLSGPGVPDPGPAATPIEKTMCFEAVPEHGMVLTNDAKTFLGAPARLMRVTINVDNADQLR